MRRELDSQNIESYQPVFEETARWSDRIVSVARPLFPGYLFCRLDVATRPAALLQIHGVIQLLPRNLTPETIPAAEIDAIRVALASRLPLAACAYEPGEHVVVENGALAGTAGVVKRSNGETRLIISITMLGRAVSVTIDAACLRSL